jgi:hypothetical protein
VPVKLIALLSSCPGVLVTSTDRESPEPCVGDVDVNVDRRDFPFDRSRLNACSKRRVVALSRNPRGL